MFETIKRLYAKTGNTAIVDKAVKKGWITQEQGEGDHPAPGIKNAARVGGEE